MRRRTIVGALLATLLTAPLAGCVGQPSPTPSAPSTSSSAGTAVNVPGTVTPTGYPFTLAQLPRIDGSTANIPLISLAIQRLTGVPEAEADNAVRTTGTPNAYRNLIDGDADLLIVYEADQAVKAEIKRSGVRLELHPIGRDALVFFANASNPVTSLTTAQYRDIYTGRIANWSKVGGNDVKIVAYQRPEESGSQALLRKYVVGKAKMAKAPAELVTAEMGEIIDGVASYANTGNALGYSVYYYLANMYGVEGIKMLGASGVAPSRETIGNGSYPYTNDFYAVIRAEASADSPARKVLAWLTSEQGRQAVEDAGYVAAK